jgi:hypothetical protein
MQFEVGDKVIKEGGDYTFNGVVVAAFHKLSGVERFAVENKEGLVHIFNGKQLTKVSD